MCISYLTGIISTKAQHDVPIRIQHKRIPAHGYLWVIALANADVFERPRFFLGSVQRLEMVAVQVERVTARVEIVHDDLHDLSLFQHEGIRV